MPSVNSTNHTTKSANTLRRPKVWDSSTRVKRLDLRQSAEYIIGKLPKAN